MPSFVIEREIPGIGTKSDAVFQKIAAKSRKYSTAWAPDPWQQSYVTRDKMYCIYIAPHAAIIREHARRGDFPANSVLPWPV